MKTILGFMAALVLVLMPLVCYQPSLRGGFLWDDDAHVTENLTIQDPGGVSRIWFEPGAVPQYYPVTHTAFWLEYQLWGDWSMGYRLVNVILHGLCALLVWLILRKLRVPGALVVAAIFAVHPMHVESVAWISELKNVLSGTFYLLALYTWLFFVSPLELPAKAKRNWWLYGLCALLFVAALLSKTVTATLPAVMFLLLWWKRPRLKMRDVWPLVPLFVVGVVLGLVTVLFEKHFIGAQGTEFGFSPIDRFLIAGRALWFYATKLMWPDPLIFFYPRWVIDPTAVVQYLYPIGALAVMALLFVFRKKLGKGPLVAVLFFAGTLMPALGFFDVYPFVFSFVANHFAYLASLGVITLVVGALATLAAKLGKGGQWAGCVLAVVVVGLLGGMTWHQSKAYLDSETLYLDVIAKNPRAWMAQNNLANYYIGQNKWEQAKKYITQSLVVKPDNDRARKTMAVVYQHFGENEKAIDQYTRALNLNSQDPSAYISLARLLLDEGRVDQAKKYLSAVLMDNPESSHALTVMGFADLKAGNDEAAQVNFKRAQKIDPTDYEPIAGMGRVMEAKKDIAAAIRMYNQSLDLEPVQPDIQNNLATLLAQQGKTAAAVQHFRLALEQKPTLLAARRNLAKILVHMGKDKEALAQYTQILRQVPGDVEALIAVADAHVGSNEFALAQAGYEKVLKLDPLNALAHNNLGVVLMMSGQDTQAAKHIENALKLSPDLVDGWFNLGLLNLKHQRIGPAVKAFTQALKLDPDNGGASFQLGWIYELQQQDAQAVAAYRRALELIPKSPQVNERLAWVLATTKIPALRSPQEAVELALQATKLTRVKDAGTFDTLGVAQASAGQFKEAMASARRAMKLAKEAGQEDQAQQIQQRITLYKANQPYVALPAAK